MGKLSSPAILKEGAKAAVFFFLFASAGTIEPFSGNFIFAIEKTDINTSPKIILSYPQNNPANKEVEIFFSVSNLKNTAYDVKISIEKGSVLSNAYNENQNKWQSSYYYIKNLFSGSSFEGKFRLKIREESLNFQGEADILVRVRESGKSSYLEHREKINITEPELRPKEEYLLVPAKDLAAISQQTSGLSVSSRILLIAFALAIFSGIIILILKKKLKTKDVSQ